MKFAGDACTARAFIFALVASYKNSNYIAPSGLVAGLSRFGVDSPSPIISTRCGLYGNSKTIMEILEEAEKKYGSETVNAKQYQGGKELQAQKPTMLMKSAN